MDLSQRGWVKEVRPEYVCLGTLYAEVRLLGALESSLYVEGFIELSSRGTQHRKGHNRTQGTLARRGKLKQANKSRI